MDFVHPLEKLAVESVQFYEAVTTDPWNHEAKECDRVRAIHDQQVAIMKVIQAEALYQKFTSRPEMLPFEWRVAKNMVRDAVNGVNARNLLA
jgi:hypothetical protein